MAMHTYSAIPDIDVDKEVGIITTAGFLGKNKTLIYCGTLRALSTLLASLTLSWIIAPLGIIYL
jgi:4-hydroxybenzoate polyprenyltransferase